MPPRRKPDYRLAIGYGSAWHVLRCLGWHRERFNAQIADEIGATRVTWLDFPRASWGKRSYLSGMPVRDGEWERIGFVADETVQHEYDRFWPRGHAQQNWDAVGKAVVGGADEWLLVEAKAYPGEVRCFGTKAAETGGRPMIRAAFEDTLKALGCADADASVRAEVWLSGWYQHANRLATLWFLTKHKIPARLIFLYFCGDSQPGGKSRPPGPTEWQPTLKKIYNSLGLKGNTVLETRVHNIFVDINFAGSTPEATISAAKQGEGFR